MSEIHQLQNHQFFTALQQYTEVILILKIDYLDFTGKIYLTIHVHVVINIQARPFLHILDKDVIQT